VTPDLPPLREVIARHGLSASKALGQNFLFDGQLLARIAAIPSHLADAEVLEVGPGPGGLTRALLAAGARVAAIERDRRCLPALAELEAAGRISSPTCPIMSAPLCSSAGCRPIGNPGGRA
jgi:16S rRNA (adenine1518-N6/adenine1519-N6)-dimethyltransferase